MTPFKVASEVEALQSISSKLEGKTAELARFEENKFPPLPLSLAWTRFLSSSDRPDSGEATLYQYECQFSAFAKWMKQAHPEIIALREITKEMAEEYAGTLKLKFSSNTFNKHLNLLALLFRVLKEPAKLQMNPWENIKRKKLISHSRRELTIEELNKVCQSATGELKTLFALGIYSGMRLGDCATLRWGETDLLQKIIRRIPNKIARRDNAKPVIIPIHTVLHQMLSSIPVEDRGEYVLPQIAALYLKRTDLVTDLIQSHFIECGIKPYKPGTGKGGKRAVLEVGFHSMRHTFVSLCSRNNTPLAVVQALVGHSNPAMVRHYTHVGTVATGNAVAGLPSVFGNENIVELAPPPAGNLLSETRRELMLLNKENWQEKRDFLLQLLAKQELPLLLNVK